jgi:RND superfamily putative drug exporter
MSPLKRSNNIAARMGRWSASHWKTAVFGWLVFVVASLVIGMNMGMKSMSSQDENVGQSHRADQILNHAGFKAEPQSEIVVISSSRLKATDPAFRAVVRDEISAVRGHALVTNVRSPYDPAHADQISKDGRTVMVTWEMKGELKEAERRIDPIVAATNRVGAAHPEFFVGEAGAVSSDKAISKAFDSQLKQAGERSIPLTLIVLLLVFGALVAATVPIIVALTAVAATIGLVSIASQWVPMDQNVSAVILLVGLAVGVDYSLFYIKREREERAAGKGHRAALEAAAATSGRSVLISGVTVMVAMAGMLLSGDKVYLSFGIATMLVVGIAMIGSLTVLPALLSKLGDRVEKGRIPILKRLRRQSGENRFWSAILTPALKRPGLSALAAGAVLVAMTLPVLHIHTGQMGFDSVPKSWPTVQTINKVRDAFPGGDSPAVVAIKADTDSADTKNAINDLRARALASGQMHGPIDVAINPSHTVARVTIPLAGGGTDAKSNAALQTLRNDVLPATVGKVPGATYAVTGQTAITYDDSSLLKRKWPIVFAFVLTLAFLLLLVSFRSIVVALKAIVLNLLSVGAAYGVLVAVFQWGWGENLLNFQSYGGIAYWLPIFLFVILFGLSMDYHVFILSRVREAYDRGMKTEDAVAHGIKTTAGVVTSAAVVMVGAFGIFATLPLVDMKQMGVGLAAAVLIDATIVRAVLLPATMKLLGDANWYLPRWLEWLPRLEHEARPEAAPAPEPAPALAA